MKRLIKIFLYSLYLVKICTNGNPLQGASNYIMPAVVNEFPFIVSLAEAPANQPDDHFCGGTLISKRHVLTATHCFLDPETHLPQLNAENVRVRIGSNDLTLGRNIGIRFWTTYEQWANIPIASTYDVSIVTLSEEVTDIEPAFISQCKHRHLRGRKAVTAGWGLMNGDFQPRLLQKTTLHVLARKKCRRIFDEINEVTSSVVNNLCTVHNPKVVLGCGDSGGPLLINGNELIGVNKATCDHNITNFNDQNAHQSVEYYRNFIEAFAERKAPCPFKC